VIQTSFPAGPIAAAQPAPVDPGHQAAAEALRETADSLRLLLLDRDLAAMSGWANWLGAAVGALGVLFAAGAIASGFLLFRQSREYRETISTELDKYRETFDALLERFNADAEASLLSIREREKRLNEEYKTAGDERRAELDKELADLRLQKEASIGVISQIAGEAIADSQRRRHHQEEVDWIAREADQPRLFRCRKCRRFLSQVGTVMISSPAGDSDRRCRFCKGEVREFKRSFADYVTERPDSRDTDQEGQ
jgi:hypothetical protein